MSSSTYEPDEGCCLGTPTHSMRIGIDILRSSTGLAASSITRGYMPLPSRYASKAASCGRFARLHSKPSVHLVRWAGRMRTACAHGVPGRSPPCRSMRSHRRCHGLGWMPRPAYEPRLGKHETEKASRLPPAGLFLYMARPERFELPTAWFVARYSIQLSYGRVFFTSCR